MEATLTFLGSGTSMGVPTLGCACAVCTSAMSPTGDPRNRRTRPSIRLDYAGHTVVIDTGPDFHAQALREGLKRLDAVLYTHGHADHVMGFDDLRPLSFHPKGNLPVYADDSTADDIERIFEYTFRKENRYPTSARVEMHRIDSAPGACFDLFDACFQRIPVTHGQQQITGYRFGNAAYLTDMSDIPAESVPLLQNLDVLILDALRRDPHSSHSHLEKSISFVEQLKPRRAFFTHMSHDLDHAATEAILPPHIRLAYDGLKINFEIAPMNIYRELADIPPDFGPSVATIGNFDGVHRGHRSIIAEVVRHASELGVHSVAITFDPHPARVLRPEQRRPLITPLAQKIELLAGTGLDALLVLPFTGDLSRMTARAFSAEVLQRALHVTELHEGKNFRLGYQAEAGVENLRHLGEELGFKLYVHGSQRIRGQAVSSSRIRELISRGEVSHARALLGRPFAIVSTPAPGRGYGTRYTVPTINLTPYSELLPANGVYVTMLTVGSGSSQEAFEAVTNVGNRPTFGADSFAVESHLLNFHPIELSEKTPLTLSFLFRLRAEQRFPSPEALREQIGRDVRRAQRYFTLCAAVAGKPRSSAAQQISQTV
jgi:riboflavin kinase/FMN adenylyltransferase